MTFLASFGLLIGGILFLLIGAEGLVRGSAALAIRFGLAPLVVGLTIVAFGTSSPELVVSIDAALKGQGPLAVGNIVGSNIANLALIVGVAIVLSPMAISRDLLRRDMPILLVVSIVLVLFLLDGEMGRLEGVLFSVGFIIYLSYTIRASIMEARGKGEVELAPEVEDVLEHSQTTLWKSGVFIVGGCAMLLLGSHWLIDGAVGLARLFGVSEAVIGLTMVAFGTSLPELATTIAAAHRGHGQMALGNAVGSNFFNIMGVLGPASIIAPMGTAGVGLDSLLIMVGITVVAFLFFATERFMKRWKGGVLMLLYVAYIMLIVLR